MPKDEFELLLERCRENLSGITLSIPTIEKDAPRPPTLYSLEPPAAPPKAAEPAAFHLPPKPPEAIRPEAPPPPAEPEPAPEPDPEPTRPVAEERETDVFPPVYAAPQTPPPSAQLWRVQPPAPAESSDRRRPELSARNGRRAAAAAVVAAAGAAGLWLARRPAADLRIEVGDADAMAVRPEKDDLLVAEGKELLDLSRDGRTLGRKPLDAPVDSLCWEHGSLWSADGRTASVVEHADDGRSTVFTLNHVPGALYLKDKYLWTAEKGGSVIHQFLISRSILGALLQPLDSYQLSGLFPAAFAIDEAGFLWIADQPTRRLVRLRFENGSYKQVASAPLSPFLGPEGKLRDLTIEGGAVWILTQQGNAGRSFLRRIVLTHLDWTPA